MTRKSILNAWVLFFVMVGKLKVGFFSFTCDEGCMINVLEALNSRFELWLDKLDIKYCRLLKSKNEFGDSDVSFVEGAISSEEEENRLKEIRQASKKLVFLGNCAISGSPTNHRNFFDEARLKEIQPVLDKFKLYPKIKSCKDVVKGDYELLGCPMNEKQFIALIDKLINEGVIKS